MAGIGNAYSDEILWAARLAPYRKRSSLAADEVDALYAAVREVLPWAIAEIHELVPPRLEVEQREFLKVHRKGGEACPRCGTRLSQVQCRWLRHDFLPRLPALGINNAPAQQVRGALVGSQKGSWRRPIFPRGYPLSIFGAGELNFRVRDGNGCGLSAGVTRILYEVTT